MIRYLPIKINFLPYVVLAITYPDKNVTSHGSSRKYPVEFKFVPLAGKQIGLTIYRQESKLSSPYCLSSRQKL